MEHSTRRFFNSEFVIKNNLSFSEVIILQDIYFWILGRNGPKSCIVNGKTYYYISQSHIAELNYGLLSQPRVNIIFKKLKQIGIIDSNITIDIYKNYISLNWSKIKESLLGEEILMEIENNEWWKRIHKYADEQIAMEKRYNENDMLNQGYEIVIKNNRQYLVKKPESESYNKKQKEKNMAGLLDDNDMKDQKYCKEADMIARRILTKYRTIFINRFPNDNEKPTKTYIRICQKITDIYNGVFTSSRFYNFDENVFKNKQFDTEGWKDKINEVKGDWGKVKKLILKAVDNFTMMIDEDRMPMKKDYLTNSLNDWFFSDNPNNKGQSQFIQSLKEPMMIKQKLGLDKAKTIVDDLKSKSPVSYSSGHELNELLPDNANESTAWNYIMNIIKWGKLLFRYDENAKYFLECKIDGKIESGPKVLPALFARYLVENKISVSLNTLNIEQAVDSNAPWCWFIEDACRKHDMNFQVSKCLNESDFFDAYKVPDADDAFVIF